MTEADTENRPLSSLQRRIGSAVILIPVGLAVVWMGGWVFSLFVAFVSVLMAFEWNRLISGKAVTAVFAVHALTSVAALLTLQDGQFMPALALAAGGALGAALLSWRRWHGPLWAFGGVLYTVLPSMGAVWLRLFVEEGRAIVLSVVFVVIAIDTGAYWAGKTFGGPKLAPRFSPSKTWAGLMGAAVWGGLAASFSAFLLNWSPLLLYLVLGAGLALIAQAGDLAESAVKRHFNVKDMGSLIPGHGGVLDRLDGMMMAVLVIVALVLTRAPGN